MMAAARIDYQVGQHVGFVDVDRRLELPLPKMFFILRVTPGRDGKVIDALRLRDVSAWSPREVRTVDRRTGREARKPHLGRTIVKPMIPGLVFVPDFDAERVVKVAFVEDWLYERSTIVYDAFGKEVAGGHKRLATLSREGMRKLVEIEASLNLSGSARKVALEQLVRITRGQFADFVGKVERLDSGGRLKVFIAALMGGASVTVDEAQVDPVSQRAACATARRPKRKRRGKPKT